MCVSVHVLCKLCARSVHVLCTFCASCVHVVCMFCASCVHIPCKLCARSVHIVSTDYVWIVYIVRNALCLPVSNLIIIVIVSTYTTVYWLCVRVWMLI